MSKKHNLSTKLSDLEFVEELSDLEVEAVAGGTSLADDLIEDVLDDLSERRAKAERKFKKNFPELAKFIFDDDDDDDH